MKKIFFSIFVLLYGISMYSQAVLMKINSDTIFTKDFEIQQQKSLKLIGVQQTINNYIDFNLLKQYALSYKVDKSEMYERLLIKEGEKLKDSLYYRKDLIEPLLQDYYQKIIKDRKIQILFFEDNFLSSHGKNRKKFVQDLIKNINNNTTKFSEAVEKYSILLNFKIPAYYDLFILNKSLVNEIYKAPLNKVYEVNQDQGNYLILVSEERNYLGELELKEYRIKNNSPSSKNIADLIYDDLKNNKSVDNILKNNDSILFFHDIKLKVINNDDLYNQVLNNSSAVLKPIRTDSCYSVYVVKDRIQYDQYSKVRKRLYNRLLQSNMVGDLNLNLINELKNKVSFKEDEDEIKLFKQNLPKNYNDFKNFTLSDTKTLVNIGNGEYLYTNQDLLNILKQNITDKNINEVENLINIYINSWENTYLVQYYDIFYFELDRYKEEWKKLNDKLLINAAISIITDKAINDTEGQKKYLKENQQQFIWKERINGDFYYCLNNEVKNKVLELLNDKKSVEEIKLLYKDKVNAQNEPLLIINQGKLTRESLNLPNDIKLDKKVYTTDYKTKKLVINIKDIKNNDPMDLEEFRTNYIDLYIDFKMDQEIKKLKSKAKIEIVPSQEKELESKYSK
ncbi:hypothetical protein O2K51_02355 [Apibacter raozihei]|uniref:hypothetical protein n=1 Tax=Apibacter raozihei TaxID=2500547 RepID=UPI000FE3CFF6|nr:hypothetical protein [Apibacter raozihei]